MKQNRSVTEGAPPRNADSLSAALLVSRINERASGRLRGLAVNCIDGCVKVRGSADSYYAWQLAIAACQQVLAGTRDTSLDFQFDVRSPSTIEHRS